MDGTTSPKRDSELWDAYSEDTTPPQAPSPHHQKQAAAANGPSEAMPERGIDTPPRRIIDYRGFIDLEMQQESNLVKHAMRELRLIGEEPRVVKGYLDMIHIFASMGHSGSSAAFFTTVLEKLLQFENLKPLTNDPAEWVYVGEYSGGEDIWQNSRHSRAFSNDMGKTYYILDEAREKGFTNGEQVRIIHTSEVVA